MEKVGTLKEIGAKVGDVVEDRNGCFKVDNLDLEQCRNENYTIIKRAETGPVREVKTVTKEIVMGQYGALDVRGHLNGIVNLRVDDCLDRDELDTLISNLQAIREAM